MRPFLDSTDAVADGPELFRRVQRDGYLFIRGLLPRADLDALRAELLGIANDEGWLQAGTRVEDGIANPAGFALSDCPREMGTLTAAEGTHAHGVYDFQPAFGAGGLEVVDPLVGRWVGGDFQAGDVLIFHSLTVHKALPNLTDRLRMSMDC